MLNSYKFSKINDGSSQPKKIKCSRTTLILKFPKSKSRVGGDFDLSFFSWSDLKYKFVLEPVIKDIQDINYGNFLNKLTILEGVVNSTFITLS